MLFIYVVIEQWYAAVSTVGI